MTLVNVTLTFNEATQKQQAELAKDGRKSANIVGLWAPLGLGVVGLLMIGLATVPLSRGSSSGPGESGRRRREPATVA